VRVYALVETEGKRTWWVQRGGGIVGADPNGGFGRTVSLSADGKRIAIGDPYHSHWQILLDANSERRDYGYIKIYEYDKPGRTWKQLGQRLNSLPVMYINNAPVGEFGSAVSIYGDGTTVAAAAPYRNLFDKCPGVVRVHRYVEGRDEWEQLGDFIWQNRINCPIVLVTKKYGELYDETGYAVYLSHDGSRLAVGMPSDDIAPPGSDARDYNINVGTVALYKLDGNKWEQLRNVITGAGAKDHSGWSISLSSDGWRVVVGSPLNRDRGNDSGQVRVFELTGP